MSRTEKFMGGITFFDVISCGRLMRKHLNHHNLLIKDGYAVKEGCRGQRKRGSPRDFPPANCVPAHPLAGDATSGTCDFLIPSI